MKSMKTLIKGALFACAVATAAGVRAGTLCTGASAQTGVDLTSGTRTAQATETIVYSPFWAAEAGGQPSVNVFVKETIQELVTASTVSGTYAWTPTVPGTFTLRHQTWQDSFLKGTLTATFEVLAKVTVADVTGATYAAYTNDAPATVPFVVSAETPIKVVYTITNTAYMFPGGYTTFTTNLTATAKEMTVAVPAGQKPVAAAACEDCLTFAGDAAFGLKMRKQGSPAEPNLEYSQDQIYWSKFDLVNGAAAGADNKLYLRGTGNKVLAGATTKYFAFTNTAGSAATAIACAGNIMTLLDYETVAKGEEPSMGDYAFFRLFSGFAALTTAPELPAMKVATGCYQSMFWDCTSLTAAPALPATELAKYCYKYMFYGCTSLLAAPALPAMTLVNEGYDYMFQGCTSLTIPPELPATNLAKSCYMDMFQGCTSLTIPPELPATNLAENCYQAMFDGCTSLTAAPALPATELVTQCYNSMFDGCTSLTAAPALPAMTLAEECYQSMFFGCTSLTDVPALPSTNLAKMCYALMFKGCTSLVVNTNGAGKAWSIPSDAATSAATVSLWNAAMFKETPGSITNTTVTPGVTYYVVQRVKIPAAPAVVAHTTYKVYVDDEEVTDGQVWSNRTENVASPADPVATVVYTTEAGYYFADGETEKTVQLDTRVSPAVLAGEAPGAAAKPSVQLGVVAQRYPWNGQLDVGYWAKNTPNGAYQIKVTVTLPDGTSASQTVDALNGKNTAVFDAKEAFGEVKLTGVKVTAELVEDKK